MDTHGSNLSAAMIIDSHVHFWEFDAIRDAWITEDMYVLRRNYLPADLSVVLKENKVNGCIAVQADQSEHETISLVKLAETNPCIKGVVGWTDLRAANLQKRLEYFSQFPVIKGWRHIVQGEPDDFLLRTEFQEGVRMLGKYRYTYDVLIYHHQLKPALEFVSRFPEQKLIIDHCAKPGIKSKNISEWKHYMTGIAVHPNVYCKLSGLLTETHWGNWQEADFYPYLDIVFEVFGTNRLLFGSDWPVMLLSGKYAQWKNILEKYMEVYTEEEKQHVFGLNAARFYNL